MPVLLPLAPLLVLAWSLSPVAGRQEVPPCPPVRVPDIQAKANIFSAEAEARLGDIGARQLELGSRVIEDASLTGYLRAVGERLLGALPPQTAAFDFRIIDAPSANAFSLPGGRIYVSRKLVGVMRSEEELASVLAHEIGHVVTHDGAIALSRAFRDILHLDHVEGDELFDRVNELIESGKRLERGPNDDEGQRAADRIGLEILEAAGYQRDVMPAFFDRFAALGGRTGSALSDFLGSTPPEGRRLREMMRLATSDGCGPRPAAARPSPQTFETWQQEVLRYRGIGHAESLPGLVGRQKLHPPLKADLAILRFSPDGRYVLAQDASSVSLFARDGLRHLFRIDAEGARPARFSPDSRHVTFFSMPPFGSPRVERWSVESRTQEVSEVHLSGGCLQSALSPDGRTFVCLARGENYNPVLSLDLRVIDVPTEALVLERKVFVTLEAVDVARGVMGGLANAELSAVDIAFSPDGRFLLLGNSKASAGIDLQSRKELTLARGVRRMMSSGFVFTGADTLAGCVDSELVVVRFPDGTAISDPLRLGASMFMRPVARGNLLIVGPLKSAAAGVLDLESRTFRLLLPGRAGDVFDGVCVRERADGKLALHSIDDGSEIVSGQVPEGELGTIRAGDVSRDGRFLAVSGQARAGVWDLRDGSRVLHIRGFESAWLGETNALHAVVRPDDRSPRARVRFDLAAPPAFRERAGEPGVRWSQDGRFVLTVRPAAPRQPSRDVTIEVADARTEALLWSRSFPYEPPSKLLDPFTGFLVLAWPMSDGQARKVVTGDSAWQKVLGTVKDRKDLVCFELIDAVSGEVRGRVPVSGATTVLSYARAVATADRLFVLEGGGTGRLLAYSHDGRVKARALATHFVVSPDGRRVAVSTAPGRIEILDAKTLEPQVRLDLATKVSMAAFPSDGDRLLVLGSDQTAYTFDLRTR